MAMLPPILGTPGLPGRKTIPNSPGRGTEAEAAAASSAATVSAHMRAVANGVSGTVIDKGPLNRYVPYLLQSIRHGMQDMGTQSISDLHDQMYTGKLRFELRSSSAQKEGGVHDLHSFTQRLYA